ncbi:ABC transporter ATP-binding protein [Clostridium sp. AM22-11AC]|uniref:ABC transporter ATP-binding protein n=1 Tax=Clostridium sp. AM22-11AC TaxID=2293024 RepID=UPI000A656F9A|nr:ABC transporter ATP-binding protein [Clostridium sp. AM22-11AC]RHQ06625.1 ABC transporter ATP-binding protein [Clostridium sp. AM51-4]RHT26247.1 ABC transporter ATP-binding protein [Clostridium sp. AM32-2]RHU37661.1 ABC transporter ATP-binding protein [Clostridium sp. TM06-18]RHV53974.1 ABC transporter ATP-binding protein [Clostridium sp. OM04-12AA]
MLDVKDLNVYYGKIHAIKNISLTVEEGELVSLIGANGAGKTSLLTAIMGQIPSTGQISFEGQAVHGNGTMEIVRNGMTMVPEGRRVFPRTSVMDNLLLGAYSRKDKENVKGDLNKIFEMFPRLLERKNQLAGTLSGGEQQMLAMGRALMSRPRLLLLDEPSMGLSPRLVDQVFDTIVSINKSGTTIMLVEQNANQALRVAKRGYVIETGEIVLSDDADKLLSNPQVKEAYLGG